VERPGELVGVPGHATHYKGELDKKQWGLKTVAHGNNRTFTCPYHGWSFSTDGKLVERPGELVGVPGHATHYKGELDKKQWGLKTVA
ncbi:hypothetical protein CTI14_65845, partial [Methylobacterium radiotolerans]